jgi:ferredoxin-NADP reductase
MKLKLEAVRQETADVKSFIFTPQHPFNWKAGQFLHYSLPHPDQDDRGIKRWFTNSAAPSEKHVMITTRLAGEQGSSFKKALSSLKIGDEIEADEPEGDFIVEDSGPNYIFIAGGIGITPYRSILVDADSKGQKLKVNLLYANRSNDFPFKHDLARLATKNLNLKIDYIIDPDKIDEQKIKAAIADSENPVIYISGPEPMVEALYEELQEKGVDKNRIKADYFPNYTDEYRKN